MEAPPPGWVPPSALRRARPQALETTADTNKSLLQTMFPGFAFDTVLVALSAVELATYGALICFLPTVGQGYPTLCGLYSWGAAYAPQIASGALWRLLAPTFLHASFSHVLTNVIFQLRLGFSVEESLGHWRFAVLYFTTGAFGSLMSAAMTPQTVAVGASTSALGLLGALLARAYLGETAQSHGLAVSSIAILILVNSGPQADVFGHLGGLLAGFLLYIVLHKGETSPGHLRGTALAALATFTLIGSVELHKLAGMTPEALGMMSRCPGMLTNVATGAAKVGSAMQ
ncbi:ROM3 [Symbiodinium pilosum]|uniref:Rhomboid-like protease n=1 Tax=Symbiodinium pilosum TaxID=2952 RepID=A0A812IQP6_SYMPI|nr:ROM3 [Symbiodinium pilosum]